jgi:hypothetical protein
MGLEQTIKEVLGNPSGQTQEPNQEGTPNRQTELKAGEAAKPDYESGVDFSDIPEQIRTQVKEKFKTKAKLLEDGYQGKFKEVSQFKKAQDELIKMGLTTQEAYDVLAKYIEQKKNPEKTVEQKKEAVKTLDKLISEAPFEQREALTQMRQIILEETEIGELKKQVSQLSDFVKILSGKHFEDRRDSANSELDKLAEIYGKEIVDKYRDKVIDISLRFPQESVRKILFHEASDDLEKSFLEKKEGKKEILNQEKKNAISSSGSGVSGASEMIETKGKSFAQLIQDVKKVMR